MLCCSSLHEILSLLSSTSPSMLGLFFSLPDSSFSLPLSLPLVSLSLSLSSQSQSSRRKGAQLSSTSPTTTMEPSRWCGSRRRLAYTSSTSKWKECTSPAVRSTFEQSTDQRQEAVRLRMRSAESSRLRGWQPAHPSLSLTCCCLRFASLT